MFKTRFSTLGNIFWAFLEFSNCFDFFEFFPSLDPESTLNKKMRAVETFLRVFGTFLGFRNIIFFQAVNLQL